MSSRANRIAVLIDGPNLHATSKRLGFDVDFKRLLTEFESRGSLMRGPGLVRAPAANEMERRKGSGAMILTTSNALLNM
jgi:hypothetical protein